ncbi:hypothetical protein OOK29_25855 [Streptomyces phaeochromogenes]|uniref:hypothetical protein n=1 Tax=Streptomyces phaeochromogenes TaxID=1923 RepID=UPI00224C7F8D|nr:hypothetical protein [Streptomyces phaeochromogenes]MCX5601579.1 hypothetical protein [Streptomyces phaeochromogenes]
MSTTAPAEEITPQIAAEVLHHYGHRDTHKPDAFYGLLVKLMAKADYANARSLANAFPTWAAAVDLARYSSTGTDTLAAIAAGTPRPSVAPNDYSPFADADPRYRHVFPTPVFFPDPIPGGLALAACLQLSVVPDESLQILDLDAPPIGLCSDCVDWIRTGTDRPSDKPYIECVGCETPTQHDGLCAVCRIEGHDRWKAGTRKTPQLTS